MLRRADMVADSLRYASMPSGTEDYISHVEIDPVEEIYAIHVGMKLVAEKELGFASIVQECKSRPVTVSFTTKRLRKVSFFYGTYRRCTAPVENNAPGNHQARCRG